MDSLHGLISRKETLNRIGYRSSLRVGQLSGCLVLVALGEVFGGHGWLANGGRWARAEQQGMP